MSREPRRQVAWRVVPTLVLLLSLAPILSPTAARAGDDRRPLTLRQLDRPTPELLSELAGLKRREAIDRLKQLLASSPQGELKAAMMLRLADLYFQEGRALYLAEMARCGDDPGCDTSGSAAWHDRSIELYRTVLRSYPRLADADQATFLLGSALAELGREQEAVEAFVQLTKLWPSSPYSEDAWLLIGDHYFDVEEDAQRALIAYTRAAAAAGPKQAYATYRQGWCSYNLGDHDAAIQALQRVVEAADDPTDAKFALGEQALGDLVLFYADADRIDDARRYLERIGRVDLVPQALRRLAETLAEQGKHEEQIEVLRELILERPDDPANPDHQADLIGSLDRLGRRDAVLAELGRLRETYGPGSAWARANPDRLDEAQQQAEGLHRDLATRWHQAARQRDRAHDREAEALYRDAGLVYRAYVEAWPDDAHVAEVRYAWGELAYRLGDFPLAHEQYVVVVDHDPRGPHARFCAEAAVHAAEAQVKAEGGALLPRKVTPTRDTLPLPLTAWEQRLLDAAARFAALYPSDPELKDLLYRSAYLQYARFRFDEASALFRQVVALDPRSAEAKLAADLILDALVIREDWDSLATTARAFSEQQDLGDALFRADLHEVHVKAEFRRIEVGLERDGDTSAAADRFLAFADEFPDAEVAPQALNNAAAHYASAGRLGDAMAVRQRLIALGPASRYHREQVALLGSDRERTADWVGAAELYEELWTLPPRDDRSADALFTAAVLRVALGDVERALDDVDAFAAERPQDPRAADLLLRVVRSLEDRGADAQVAERCAAFDRSPPPGATTAQRYWARVHLASALDRLRRGAEACSVHAQTLERLRAEPNPDPAAVHLVAEARLDRLGPALERYGALRISGAGPGASKAAQDRALADSLGRKVRALNAIEAELGAIVDTGAGGPGIEALVRLGGLYEDLARALADSDRPVGLTPDQLDDYDRGVGDGVYTQEQKAVAAYALALSKGRELGLYGPATATAARRLAALRPDDWPGLEEQLPAGPYLASGSRSARGGYAPALSGPDGVSGPEGAAGPEAGSAPD